MISQITLADLALIHTRVGHVVTLLVNGGAKTTTAHVGAYPFVGIADTALVLSETPEDYLCLFAMSEFRNRPADAIIALDLKVGDKLRIVAQPPAATRRKSLVAPPPPIDVGVTPMV